MPDAAFGPARRKKLREDQKSLGRPQRQCTGPQGTHQAIAATGGYAKSAAMPDTLCAVMRDEQTQSTGRAWRPHPARFLS